MNDPKSVTRREFVRASAAVAAAPLAVARSAHAGGSDAIRVGLIGCGGRGTGAAVNAMEASETVRIVALGDVFADRLAGCRGHLAERGQRSRVAEDRCHVGFDAYRDVIAGEVDMVILATPPHFRPLHLAAAVDAGRHVFMEKPVAVDPAGVRRVIAAGAAADARGLSIVSGTQRRHEASYLATIERIRAGALGRIVSARCYWNMGGLWVVPREPGWSDMEWQLRNWLYFTWLSGDHIVEQHVHNLDVLNWALQAHPVRANGMGGRQVRTGAEYGHIFDHFAVEYEYPGGVHALSMCRQTDGCASRVEEAIHGTLGAALTRSGFAHLSDAAGNTLWRFDEPNPNPYVQEHRDLIAGISGQGPRLNEARRVAESTLTAIMGRMSAYTGQELTWEEALDSDLDLSPPHYELGPLPTPPVPMPGAHIMKADSRQPKADGRIDRRAFIGATAVAGLVPAALNRRGAAQTARRRFHLKYAPHFGMFRHSAGDDVVGQLEFMADEGFAALEDNGMAGREVAEQERIARAMERLDMEMGVFVAHADFGNVTFAAPDAGDALAKAMHGAVETAKRVNARWCTVVPGRFDLRVAAEYQTATVIENLKRCCEVCAPAGLVMVLEPLNPRDHPGLFLTRIPQAAQICRAVGSPSCRILDDLYHQQVTEGNLIPNIDAAWSEIAYFQIGDNPGRCEPTTGEINYRTIFRHLHEQGYDGIVGMEHGNRRGGVEGERAVIEAYVACDP